MKPPCSKPRTRLWKLLIVLVAGLASSGAVSQEEFDKPNLILVLADDLSATALPAYGGESVRTPVLDRLAAEGMLFRYCFSPALCMPSRTELLTGKYSHRNYVGRGNLAPGETNIASELKEAGYATCQIEKWHLNIREGAMPPQASFDEYHHTKLANNYFDPVIDSNGVEKVYPGGYGPRECQNFAFDFIKRHQENPFFLYYAMHLPHSPYHVPPGFDLGERPTTEQKYHAMIEHQDALVGELVEHLEELKLRERTLLIFIGDNGTPKGLFYQSNGRRLEGGKASPLDSGTHVPMIVSWPGTVPAGVRSDALIDFADFLPSAMELAGAEAKPSMKLDGLSFLGQLRGDPEAPQRDYAFKFGVANGGKGAGPVNDYWARTQRWKLYGKGALYDMESDPLEEQPIAAGEGSKDAEAARKKLQKVLDESGAAEVVRVFKKAEKRG